MLRPERRVQMRLRVAVNKNRYEIIDFLDRETWTTYRNGDCFMGGMKVLAIDWRDELSVKNGVNNCLFDVKKRKTICFLLWKIR